MVNSAASVPFIPDIRHNLELTLSLVNELHLQDTLPSPYCPILLILTVNYFTCLRFLQRIQVMLYLHNFLLYVDNFLGTNICGLTAVLNDSLIAD